jgi:hypothetical protein
LNLKNYGTTAVYFEWKKETADSAFPFEKVDNAEYFHIHNVRKKLIREEKLLGQGKAEYSHLPSTQTCPDSSILDTM